MERKKKSKEKRKIKRKMVETGKAKKVGYIRKE